MIERYEATGDPDVRPDDVTFNTVMHAIANDTGNGGRADAPRRAMRLLERMEAMYESGSFFKGGKGGAKPDIITYNSVLNAFAKCGGPRSARRAENMLDKLEDSYDKSRDGMGGVGGSSSSSSSSSSSVCPDVYSYNIVISAWANCGQADRAVALLDRMAYRTKEAKARLIPDATTYNSVLHAWSQSLDRNAPVKALGLLEIMIRLHKAGGGVGDDDEDEDDDLDPHLSAAAANKDIPDVTSFSTVINAFSKSRYPRKARQARDLLRRMKHLHEHGSGGGGSGRKKRKNEALRPSNNHVFVYAAVLNACAYTFGTNEVKDEALRIGIDTYEELQRSADIVTNHVAYGSFIRVCRRLMAEDDPRRDHFISRAFRQCCSDGQLGEYVVRQLRPMARLYTTLLKAYITDEEGGDVRYQDLPAHWRCNVNDRSKPRSLSMSHLGHKTN
jgi:pentatricopeptide repeat protein